MSHWPRDLTITFVLGGCFAVFQVSPFSWTFWSLLIIVFLVLAVLDRLP